MKVYTMKKDSANLLLLLLAFAIAVVCSFDDYIISGRCEQPASSREKKCEEYKRSINFVCIVW